MDSPCIKQTVCKVLKIFQYGKYLVAYVLKTEIMHHNLVISTCGHLKYKISMPKLVLWTYICLGKSIAPDKAAYCVFTQLLGPENAIKLISVCTKTQ